MKLQIQAQELRFRIDEAELAVLLDGGEITNITALGNDVEFRQQLRLHTGAAHVFEAGTGAWTLQLPESDVREHVLQLPSKHGLSFQLERAGAAPLKVRFDIDVRDSLQHRGPRRRSASGAP